jgi:RNA polymerase sigma factor (sigma-70 family)
VLPFAPGADYLYEMNGTDLLARFRTTASEDAFAELVRRYANLVYSIAKRRLSNGALAEEAAQTVFTRLANAAPKLKTDAELVAWLHRTTVHVAIDLWRSETRRHIREQHAAAMEPVSSESNQLWDELAPKLDEALDQLSDADRQTVLLRFFERKSMREIGHIFAVSEDAAKMRVSRAIERLRLQLAPHGVACTIVVLAGVMMERSVEAAPTQLAVRPPPALNPVRTALPFPALLAVVSGKVKVATLALVGISIVVLLVLRSTRPANGEEARNANTAAEVVKKSARADRSFAQRTAAAKVNDAPTIENARLILRVLDAETGEGLANAKIHLSYFYAGGRGEGHKAVTDSSGNAAIPWANEPGDQGMNVFVNVEYHVPQVVGFGKDAPSEYTMRLEPAISAGGRVVNENGEPLAGVAVMMRKPEGKGRGLDNADFQLTSATTDADGRWIFPYMPKGLEEVRFTLIRDDYAMTQPIVQAAEVDLMNLQLVIGRGYTVAGRVTDSDGHPIPEAKIKDVGIRGSRRQTTTTAVDGTFAIHGLRDSLQSFYFVDKNGMRESSGQPFRLGEMDLRLAVQAQGFEAQQRTIRLLPATNTVLVNFTLPKGRVFRGRVVDETGQPVPGAVVRTDADDQGLRAFEWFTHVDSEGRFEWNSAPAEPVLFWFEAAGYKVIRNRSMFADGTEHQVTLRRAIP